MAGMAGRDAVIAAVRALPDDALGELAKFIEFLQFKSGGNQPTGTPYRPLQLGGLWEGVDLDEEDFKEMRREMWQSLGHNS